MSLTAGHELDREALARAVAERSRASRDRRKATRAARAARAANAVGAAPCPWTMLADGRIRAHYSAATQHECSMTHENMILQWLQPIVAARAAHDGWNLYDIGFQGDQVQPYSGPRAARERRESLYTAAIAAAHNFFRTLPGYHREA